MSFYIIIFLINQACEEKLVEHFTLFKGSLPKAQTITCSRDYKVILFSGNRITKSLIATLIQAIILPRQKENIDIMLRMKLQDSVFKIEELHSKMSIGLIPDMTLELDMLTAFVYTLTMDSPSVELISMREDVLEKVNTLQSKYQGLTEVNMVLIQLNNIETSPLSYSHLF